MTTILKFKKVWNLHSLMNYILLFLVHKPCLKIIPWKVIKIWSIILSNFRQTDGKLHFRTYVYRNVFLSFWVNNYSNSWRVWCEYDIWMWCMIWDLGEQREKLIFEVSMFCWMTVVGLGHTPKWLGKGSNRKLKYLLMTHRLYLVEYSDNTFGITSN